MRVLAAPGPVRWHRHLTWFAAAMIGWSVVSAAGLVIDDRTLTGEPIWAKPLKFSISLAVYASTLAWMLARVEGLRIGRVGGVAATVGVAASLTEIVIISAQVVRGEASHFNISTPVNAALYAVMGGGAAVMYGATLVVGAALAFFTTVHDRSMRWALRLGLVIAVAGLSVGFLMVVPTATQLAQSSPAVSGSHSVGGDDSANGLFLLGWSTRHGDLRIAHFVGMHALQAMPLLAVALSAGGQLGETARLRAVLLGAFAWAALTTLTLVQALRGQSLVHPDVWTTSVASALMVTMVALAATCLRSRPGCRAGRRRRPLRFFG